METTDLHSLLEELQNSPSLHPVLTRGHFPELLVFFPLKFFHLFCKHFPDLLFSFVGI